MRSLISAAQRAIYERLVRAKPDDIACRCQLATSYHVIGRLLADSGHSSDAIEPYHSAIAHRERLVRDHPRDVRWHNDCAGSWFRLGEAFKNLGRTAAAVEAYQKSLVYSARCALRNPERSSIALSSTSGCAGCSGC